MGDPHAMYNQKAESQSIVDEHGKMQLRRKKLQFLSISPLDRLLNQRGLKDEVRVRLRCASTVTPGKFYDITMDRDIINYQTCFDNQSLTDGKKCEP